MINIKVKLTAMWCSVMFYYVYDDHFSLLVPGLIEGMMAGQTPVGEAIPAMLMVFSLVMAIPSVMIVLSLLLPPAINKWANILTGTIYTVTVLITMLDSFSPWWAFYTLFSVLEMCIIVYSALTWPRKKAAANPG